MSCSFELMDLDMGNLVGSYADLEDALAIVHASVLAEGPDAVIGLGLIAVCNNEAQQMLAADRDLLRLAVGDGLVGTSA